MGCVGPILLATLLADGCIAGGLDSKIVGGSQASPGQFPYQCSLRFDGSHTCGCAIIAPYFAVTAAHCVWNRVSALNLFRVSTSSIRLNQGFRYRVKNICMHPRYTHQTATGYDIAVVMIEGPFRFSATANFITLANQNYYSGPAVASGWGLTSTDGADSLTLLYLSMNLLTPDECAKAIPTYTQSKICARGAVPNSGMCAGDSGGPLVTNGQLYGVVSYGPRPCGNGQVDVFTNVFQFSMYIQRAMRQMWLAPPGIPPILACPAVAAPAP